MDDIKVTNHRHPITVTGLRAFTYILLPTCSLSTCTMPLLLFFWLIVAAGISERQASADDGRLNSENISDLDTLDYKVHEDEDESSTSVTKLGQQKYPHYKVITQEQRRLSMGRGLRPTPTLHEKSVRKNLSLNDIDSFERSVDVLRTYSSSRYGEDNKPHQDVAGTTGQTSYVVTRDSLDHSTTDEENSFTHKPTNPLRLLAPIEHNKYDLKNESVFKKELDPQEQNPAFTGITRYAGGYLIENPSVVVENEDDISEDHLLPTYSFPVDSKMPQNQNVASDIQSLISPSTIENHYDPSHSLEKINEPEEENVKISKPDEEPKSYSSSFVAAEENEESTNGNHPFLSFGWNPYTDGPQRFANGDANYFLARYPHSFRTSGFVIPFPNLHSFQQHPEEKQLEPPYSPYPVSHQPILHHIGHYIHYASDLPHDGTHLIGTTEHYDVPLQWNTPPKLSHINEVLSLGEQSSFDRLPLPLTL